MERLTFFENGHWWVRLNGHMYGGFPEVDRLAAYEDTGLEPEEILSGKELAEIACALNELKAYKDTGLTPEAYKRYAEAIGKLDIAHMHELLQAEKDGRLVVLPVPVGKGQKVYGIFDAEPIPVHVQEIDCDHFDRLEIYPSGEVVVEVDGWEIGQSDIAKTVFLTREAAEKALLQKEEG
ncbi:MAG: hypothetical protein HFG44_09295 [Oscillospiraceae bacterium]|nr:hypothetical protein [Oscillospiraceae bacterium]